ncbi:MAG: [FeFe] hydrogenase H-cluster maturation GTPase HydF [Clostridiales bacterium]|nr:[FeFe] hydrogenase H-cluster maturation GTPase HydF [Clostridiales bacterium]
MNSIVSAERPHIAFFGLRNAGKSSLVNAVTGQAVSIVSDIKGTTTDVVKKSMELLPLGAVVIIDTPGIDDEGKLGELRVNVARRTLNYTDIAVLVVDGEKGIQSMDSELISLFNNKKIPYIIAFNKSDLVSEIPEKTENTIYVSSKNNLNIYELKEMIANIMKKEENDKRIVSDLINPGDIVVLVVPIDSAAPKGRIILPQQQTIRDVLDIGAIAVVTRENELKETLKNISKKPKLVITDSQVFEKVDKEVPQDVLLTSFSILFARYKGNLEEAVRGAANLDNLKDGDTVLIAEGCTHHKQCGDIGTQKLPNWIKKYTGKEINFEFTSGMEFPEDLSKYALIIHCGGCMLNEKEMQYRIRHSKDSNVPITNYGIAIAMMHGILKRSIEIFPNINEIL